MGLLFDLSRLIDTSPDLRRLGYYGRTSFPPSSPSFRIPCRLLRWHVQRALNNILPATRPAQEPLPQPVRHRYNHAGNPKHSR